MLPYTVCKGSLFLNLTAAICCCFCGGSSVHECILLDVRFTFLQAGVSKEGLSLLSPQRKQCTGNLQAVLLLMAKQPKQCR